MARSVIFVNDMGGPVLDEWVLDELDGRVVPDGGTLDVTDEVSDDELMHAIQRGLGAEFITGKRYLRINGIDKTADESLNYGNMAEGPDPAPHSLGGGDHIADTLANLNTKLTDATLDDAGDPRDPTAHAGTHVGGSDAIAPATPTGSGLMSDEDVTQLRNNLVTGLRLGGVLSINADPTKFDLAEGVGLVVDNFTNPDNPVVTKVTWGTFTGVTPVGIGAGMGATYVGIDSSGLVFQKTTELTQEEKRDVIFIGVVIHPVGLGIIVETITGPRLTFSRDSDTMDFFDAFGPFNIDGNAISSNGANLLVDRSSGLMWMTGANYVNSKKRPSIVSLPLASAASIQYGYRDGSGDWTWPFPPASAVDPGHWDNDSGILQVVPADKWTLQYQFIYPTSGTLIFLYGQSIYDSKEDATAAVRNGFVMSPTLSQTIFRGWLAVKGDATDLSDSAQASFVEAGKFGLATVITGGAIGEANTASNVGTAGTGLFKQKAGVDLEFHKLSSGSAPIGVAYDPGTDSVRLTFALPAHKDTHISGGGDAFLSTDLLEAVVKRIQESGGPTILQVGTISPNELLYRVGAGIVSVSPASVVGGNPPQHHKDSHKEGGADAFLATDLLDAVVRRLRETGGPTDLLLGAVADGQYLQRSGTAIVGAAPSSAQQATATAATATTSATDTPVSGMVITPGAGTYLAWFSSTVSHSNGNTDGYVSLYAAGAQIAHSERRFRRGNADVFYPAETHALITVAAGQPIDVRWRTAAGTITAENRSLLLLKIA